MKICHVSTEKGFRGGERQLLRIHDGILSFGYDSLIICRRDNEELARVEKSKSVYLNRFGTLLAPFKIYRIISSYKPDLIHCHDSRALSLISIVKPYIKIPVVVSRKTIYPLAETNSTKRKFAAVDHLIAVSTSAAKVVSDRFPKLPITVIPDGVIPTQGTSRKEVRELLGVSESTILFAAVGYFSTEKNVPLLRKVADLLSISFSHAKIVLIGPVAEKFRGLVENHPSILLLGKVDNAEMLYEGFDCYLSASTREGLGSALLDAVVRDIPAIALDSGGSRDIFSSADLDHCVDDEQFLKRVTTFCREGADHEQVAIRGKSARLKFSVEQLIEHHIQLYRNLCSL